MQGYLSKNKTPARARGTFSYSRDFPRRFLLFYRALFAIKSLLRWTRIQRSVTKALGFQYRVAVDLIEIDLTYLCNLRCNNCNRSSAQAPEALHIDLDVIRQFVDESFAQGRIWARIRLLGGEPTLHPQFMAIIEELSRYQARYPAVSIQVVTNGHGQKVQTIIDSLPRTVYVENSQKNGEIQPSFGPFNLAPQDSFSYTHADYRNGCSIAETCGLGLTPQGYYPCAVAGGIDRVLGVRRGRTCLPPPGDEMRDLMDVACRLCGRFKDGHYVPDKLRPPLMVQKTSSSWVRIYSEWSDRTKASKCARASE